jgi:hypothetical protein
MKPRFHQRRRASRRAKTSSEGVELAVPSRNC